MVRGRFDCPPSHQGTGFFAVATRERPVSALFSLFSYKVAQPASQPRRRPRRLDCVLSLLVDSFFDPRDSFLLFVEWNLLSSVVRRGFLPLRSSLGIFACSDDSAPSAPLSENPAGPTSKFNIEAAAAAPRPVFAYRRIINGLRHSHVPTRAKPKLRYPGR